MNERFKQLAKQAGGNPNYKAFRGYFLPPPPDYIDPATVDLEKFAELIVQECVGICDDVQRQYGQYTFTATKVKEEIKERFLGLNNEKRIYASRS